MVPSRMPSMKPAMVVIGVFNSCETFATKLRFMLSLPESESAMLLNAVASWPISSLLVTGTRMEKSPSPKLLAAADICRRGLTSR